jgi:hypothetical protein
MEEEFGTGNAWETTALWNPDAIASRGKRLKVWIRGVVPKSIL